eukprot:scaffold55440_cov45-Phaeocystis_antarctica.AAC.1
MDEIWLTRPSARETAADSSAIRSAPAGQRRETTALRCLRYAARPFFNTVVFAAHSSIYLSIYPLQRRAAAMFSAVSRLVPVRPQWSAMVRSGPQRSAHASHPYNTCSCVPTLKCL